MSANISLVATYLNHDQAESAIKKLHSAGFDMSHLSVIGSDRPNVAKTEGATALGDLKALNAAQYSCIPPERVHDYEAELSADRMLIVAHGTSEEIDRARHIIDADHPESWEGKVTCAVYYGCAD